MTEENKLVDLGMERATLGSCLIDPDAMMNVETIVSGRDFVGPGHQILFDAIYKLYSQQTDPGDMLLLKSAIGDKINDIGTGKTQGMDYILELMSKTPSALRVKKYATIVSRLSTLRALVNVAGNIAQLAYNSENETLDEIFSNARGLVDAATPNSSDEFVLTWIDSLAKFFDFQLTRIADLDAIKAGEATSWVSFPWERISHFIKYVREGMLVTVAAGSSVGKTAFLETWAEYLAQQGLKVVFFHLELSHQVMLDRRMSRNSGVAMELIEQGYMGDETHDASGRMKEWKGGITYVHSPGWTAQRIANQSRLLKDKGLCDIAIIDYFQKMRLQYVAGNNTAQARGQQAETIKICSEQLGIPFVVASQFSRKSNERNRKTAADIRDTGELEEKSNIVITLDREILEEDLPNAKAGERNPIANGRVDKNTMGKTGDFQLYYDGARFQFTDVFYDSDVEEWNN